MGMKPSGAGAPTYKDDPAAWAEHQANLLRQYRFAELDVENLSVEIESVGRSIRRELSARLAMLLCYLLRWEFQTEQRSRAWRNIIWTHRTQIELLVAENPSLKAQFTLALRVGYLDARVMAAKQSQLQPHVFPLECPYATYQIMDGNFLPV